MDASSTIVADARDYVKQHYQDKVSDKYVYHNFQHTLDVMEAAHFIGSFYELGDKEYELLALGALFHDTGYDKGRHLHEERSKLLARSFLESQHYAVEDIKTVEALIDATMKDAQPEELLQKIIRDADFSHVGSDQYWDRCSRVRQELLLTQEAFMPEEEWVQFELGFILQHKFHTDVAENLFGSIKKKNIKRLKKYRKRVQTAPESQNIPNKKKKKKKKQNQELNQINLGRGVETMFRTTYRTHVNLSSIADNKANIMLSINAIIISIVVSSLVPKFGSNQELIFPTFILLGVCLTALVFAILATRPKVTEGVFSREDIKQKKSNLLFFGNFYKMDIENFHWGMMEMIKDNDFLYSSMTRDLYYLGVVLAKKYKFLRICYGVFMYGLIVSVIAFGVAFLIKNS